jgi:hypothetical protein
MTNTEGLMFMLVGFEVFAGLFGIIVLAIGFWILQRVKNPLLRLGILVPGIILNGMYFLKADASWVIMGALFVGTPLAVLVPPFVFPSSYDLPLSFRRILRIYGVMWVVGAVLPFLFVASGLSMVPVFYWDTPLSNAMIYLCLILGEIGLAAIVSLFLHRMEVSLKAERS